ncbi:MAG: 4-hydroxy-3-methylbut-2-enyl diphosphate reductase, partial [Firmicutes bacterium]|nr:4-hydroxy-3-methylbut-2-enyl diphosphate reductase [Bacillota bacterium]
MEIILAKTAGFCFGVKRAVETAYNKVKEDKGKKIYTYGPIIHNKNVTDDLEKKGVSVTDDLENMENDCEVIIRSHGVPPQVYETLERRGIKYIDCTCPFVKKIHNIVKNCYENEAKSMIIVGNPIHPEVIGINGWCKNTAAIIETEEAAEKIKLDKEKKYAMVVQTTFKGEIFQKISDKLNREYDIDIYNTICNATAERQREVTEIAEKVDVLVILGDKNSSNTNKLYEIGKKICKKTYLCETIYDLVLKSLKKNDKIGISAGASTPPAIIKEAINIMSEENFEAMLDSSMVELHNGDI